MKKIIMITVLGVLLSTTAYAKGKDFRKKHKQIFKQLNLTKEQRSKMKTLRANNKGSMKSLRQQKKKIRQQMNTALSSNTDESKLRSLHSEITKIHGQLKDAKFERMLAIRKILTPEQRTQFFELKKQMRKNRRKGL